MKKGRGVFKCLSQKSIFDESKENFIVDGKQFVNVASHFCVLFRYGTEHIGLSYSSEINVIVELLSGLFSFFFHIFLS